MDDLEEGETSDIGKFGRNIYVSSWAAESLVSINYGTYIHLMWRV